MRDIYAELRIEHTEPDGTVWGYDCMAAEGPPLILQRLLNKRIIAVERKDLRLTFRVEDGSSLSIFSELGPYESGQITSPDGAILVF